MLKNNIELSTKMGKFVLSFLVLLVMLFSLTSMTSEATLGEKREGAETEERFDDAGNPILNAEDGEDSTDASAHEQREINPSPPPNGNILSNYYEWISPGSPSTDNNYALRISDNGGVDINYDFRTSDDLTVDFYWRYHSGDELAYMFNDEDSESSGLRAFTNGVAGKGLYFRNVFGGWDVDLSHLNVQDGEWYNIRVVLDSSDKTYSVYIDGELKGQSYYNGEGFTTSQLFRVMGRASGTSTLIDYDRFVWTNDAIHPDVSDEINSNLLHYEIEEGTGDVLHNNQSLIVFIPGIMGTEIWNEDRSEKLWKPANSIVNAPRQVRELAVNEEGQSIARNLIIGDPIADYYGEMITSLEDMGNPVLVYGYDWRMNNELNARRLEEKINNELDELGLSRVSIVAHSMGGLIASKYTRENDEKVDKLITLGTPFLGSPKSLSITETGKLFYKGGVSGWLGNAVIKDAIKEVAPNISSIYQLFPTENYFGYNDGQYYVQVREESFQERRLVNLLTYGQTTAFLNHHRTGTGEDNWVNSAHFNSAENFHNSLDLLDTLQSVDSYFIIGDQVTTQGTFQYTYHENFRILRFSDLKPINGDGTVPVASANVGDNLPKERVYYTSTEHSELTTNELVIGQVMNILKGQADRLPGMRSDPIETKKLKVKIASPVDLHVYDQEGNHMGPVEEGVVQNEIYTGSYDIFGGTKIALLEDDVYDIQLLGTDYGKMTVTFQWYDERNKEYYTIRFDDVPVTPSSTFSSVTDLNNEVNLSLDSDGDGEVDEVIQPSVSLNGKASQDMDPPELHSLIDGKEGKNEWYTSDVQLQLVAEDDESGLYFMEYWQEDKEPNIYSEPLTFQDEGIHQTFARAHDKNLNYKTLENEIKIDQTPPEIVFGDIPEEIKVGEHFNVEVDAKDGVSGIDEVNISFNEEEVSNGEEINIKEAGKHVIDVVATDKAGNEIRQIIEFEAYIPAEVSFHPKTLNLKGKGNKNATIYIAFPEGYNVDDIEPESIVINGSVHPISDTKFGFVKNPISQEGKYMIKVELDQLSKTLNEGRIQEIKLEGKLRRGQLFKGQDKVKIVK
ncbi:alpha/beta fold hydrolase [Halalkalibacillus sediminis]|nr:alpha/beta fold hydrolase [Halalkalibacillus sediminis]